MRGKWPGVGGGTDPVEGDEVISEDKKRERGQERKKVRTSFVVD